MPFAAELFPDSFRSGSYNPYCSQYTGKRPSGESDKIRYQRGKALFHYQQYKGGGKRAG